MTEEDPIQMLLDLEEEKRDLQEAFLSSDDPELSQAIALELEAVEAKIERITERLEKDFYILFANLD